MKDFKQLLFTLDDTLARQLLEDLKNENLRGPQLYTAIGKFLDRHKFTVASMEPEEDVKEQFSSALDGYDKVVAFKRAAGDDDDY